MWLTAETPCLQCLKSRPVRCVNASLYIRLCAVHVRRRLCATPVRRLMRLVRCVSCIVCCAVACCGLYDWPVVYCMCCGAVKPRGGGV